MELGSWVKDGDPMDPDYGKSLSLTSHIIRHQKLCRDQVLLTLLLAQYCPSSGRNCNMGSHHPGDHAHSSIRSLVSSAA